VQSSRKVLRAKNALRNDRVLLAVSSKERDSARVVEKPISEWL
jgi:hypothetical protein